MSKKKQIKRMREKEEFWEENGEKTL